MTNKHRLKRAEDFIILDVPLARELGVNDTLFLQRLAFWMDHATKEIEGQKWVYKTFQEWSEELPMSESTIKRVVKRLEDRGLIVTGEFNKLKQDRTKWYSVVWDHAVYGEVNMTSSKGSGWSDGEVKVTHSNQITPPNNTTDNKPPAATASEVAEEYVQPIDPEEEVQLLQERPNHGPTLSRFWRMMLKAGGLTKGTLPEHNAADKGKLRKLMQKLGPGGPTQLSYALLNYGAFTIYAKENHDFKLPAKPDITKMTHLADAILEFEPPATLPESEYQMKTVADLLGGDT